MENIKQKDNYQITEDGKGFIVVMNQCAESSNFFIKAKVFKRMEEELGLEFRGISATSTCPTCSKNNKDRFNFWHTSPSDYKETGPTYQLTEKALNKITKAKLNQEMKDNNVVSYELTEDKSGVILKVASNKFELTEGALERIKKYIKEHEKMDSCEIKGIKVTPAITAKQELEEDYEYALKTFVNDKIKFTRKITTPFGGTETIVHKGKGLQEQMKYILKVYNDELIHENNDKIQITSWSFGSKEFLD